MNPAIDSQEASCPAHRSASTVSADRATSISHRATYAFTRDGNRFARRVPRTWLNNRRTDFDW